MSSCHASRCEEYSKKTSVEREAPCFELSPNKKSTSASLSFHLFKAYAGLKNYEIEFLLKKGNIGMLMK